MSSTEIKKLRKTGIPEKSSSKNLEDEEIAKETTETDELTSCFIPTLTKV